MNQPTNHSFEAQPTAEQDFDRDYRAVDRVTEAARRIGQVAAGAGLLWLSYNSLKHVGMPYVEINPLNVSISTPDYLSAGIGAGSYFAGVTTIIHGVIPRDKA